MGTEEEDKGIASFSYADAVKPIFESKISITL